MTDRGYLVAIKSSARRTSPAVGQWVNDEGPRRRFDSKDEAREWAADCSATVGRGRDASATGTDARGRVLVWIQDAVPGDDSDVDGYLVAGERYSRSAGEGPGVQAEFESVAESDGG